MYGDKWRNTKRQTLFAQMQEDVLYSREQKENANGRNESFLLTSKFSECTRKRMVDSRFDDRTKREIGRQTEDT